MTDNRNEGAKMTNDSKVMKPSTIVENKKIQLTEEELKKVSGGTFSDPERVARFGLGQSSDQGSNRYDNRKKHRRQDRDRPRHSRHERRAKGRPVGSCYGWSRDD
jgi:bacteriocin-like protein